MDNEYEVIIPFGCVFTRCACTFWTIPRSALGEIVCTYCSLTLQETGPDDITFPKFVKLTYLTNRREFLEPKRYRKRDEHETQDPSLFGPDLRDNDAGDSNGEFNLGQ